MKENNKQSVINKALERCKSPELLVWLNEVKDADKKDFKAVLKKFRSIITLIPESELEIGREVVNLANDWELFEEVSYSEESKVWLSKARKIIKEDKAPDKDLCNLIKSAPTDIHIIEYEHIMDVVSEIQKMFDNELLIPEYDDKDEIYKELLTEAADVLEVPVKENYKKQSEGGKSTSDKYKRLREIAWKLYEEKKKVNKDLKPASAAKYIFPILKNKKKPDEPDFAFSTLVTWLRDKEKYK